MNVFISGPDLSAPFRMEPDQLLALCRERVKNHSSLRDLARHFSPKEIEFLILARGGTVQELMLKELQRIFQEESQRVINSFLGQALTPTLSRQIQFVLDGLCSRFNEARKLLADTRTFSVRFDPEIQTIIIEGVS